MSFQVLEVTSPDEFDAIWPVHFQSFRTPYNTYSKFFNPVHTTLEAAIETSKERHIKMWHGNPASHWIKAIDTETGDVVGAALWNFNLEVQASSDNKVFDAYWHIAGSDEKAFAEKLIGGLRGFVSQRVTSPHLELGQMVVHPQHRKHGIGRMLVEWGTHKADEHGVEAIIVAVPFAVPMYERLGFGRINQIDIDFNVADPSEKWKEYQAEDLRAFLMWRPAGRDFHSGDKAPRHDGE